VMTAARRIALLATVVFVAACSSAPKEPSSAQQQPIPQPPPSAGSQLTPTPPATPRQRAELHTDLAAGYYERGQFDVALEELAIASQLDSTYPRIYNVYGLVYTMLDDPQKAEASFGRALSLAPDDSDIRHNWGAYLCTHGRAAQSIPEFEQVIRNPLYKSPEVALINAGKCSAAIGKTAEAEAYFRRALAMQPANPTASYNLALLTYKSGRYADSRALLRTVMQQANPPPETLFLGVCVERKLGDRAAETSYTTQLRNRFPDAAETRAVATGTGCD
jgi:type IV pilus assembly protein PilF